MHPSPSILALTWARLMTLVALAAIVVLCVFVLAGLADAALVATAPAGDGPLLAPFRWSPIAADLG